MDNKKPFYSEGNLSKEPAIRAKIKMLESLIEIVTELIENSENPDDATQDLLGTLYTLAEKGGDDVAIFGATEWVDVLHGLADRLNERLKGGYYA